MKLIWQTFADRLHKLRHTKRTTLHLVVTSFMNRYDRHARDVSVPMCNPIIAGGMNVKLLYAFRGSSRAYNLRSHSAADLNRGFTLPDVPTIVARTPERVADDEPAMHLACWHCMRALQSLYKNKLVAPNSFWLDMS